MMHHQPVLSHSSRAKLCSTVLIWKTSLNFDSESTNETGFIAFSELWLSFSCDFYSIAIIASESICKRSRPVIFTQVLPSLSSATLSMARIGLVANALLS